MTEAFTLLTSIFKPAEQSGFGIYHVSMQFVVSVLALLALDLTEKGLQHRPHTLAGLLARAGACPVDGGY